MIQLLQEAYVLQNANLAEEIVDVLDGAGFELTEDVYQEDLPDVIDEVLENEDLDPEIAQQLEALGKKLRRGVAKAAHAAGRVVGGAQRAHKAVKKKKLQLKRKAAKARAKAGRKVAGAKKAWQKTKKAATAAYKAGHAGKKMAPRKASPQQKRQRQKAAQQSARRRKGRRKPTPLQRRRRQGHGKKHTISVKTGALSQHQRKLRKAGK